MFSGSSNFVNDVDTAFLIVVAVSVFFLVLVTTLMLYFVFRYSRKRNPKATNIHGSVPLEVAWTVIPTLIVLVMFWYGWVGYKDMSTPPDNALPIDVQGQMWAWKFKYSNGVQTDTLFVPLNQPVKLNIRSIDVDHSLYIPSFRVKKDAIPGRTNYAWFKAEQTGTFNIFCAEYCGLRHSYMLSHVVVLPKTDFDLLLAKRSPAGTKPAVDSSATTAGPTDTLSNKSAGRDASK